MLSMTLRRQLSNIMVLYTVVMVTYGASILVLINAIKTM